MTFKDLYAISFDFYENSYEENLNKLLTNIKKTSTNSIVVAPELCLTNFSFSKMQKAATFGEKALEKILNLSENRVICFSLTTKKDEKFFNTAVILYNKKIVYQRDKYKLFKFGNEDKYFSPGKEEDIKIITINDTKFGVLICFEIRFIDLWKKLQGVDVLLVPALWGKARKKQLQIISDALAVINQCYVVVANSKNQDMAASSAIISPFGESLRNDLADILKAPFSKQEIKKMRRYMDVGIK